MVTFDGASLVNLVAELQDRKQYQELNWSGSFGDYLELVARNPRVTRTAFQRIYDMVMSYGTEEFIDAKKKLVRYKFFSDPSIDTADAIFGLEIPLMRLVSFLRSAAEGYGTERRVLLLHGPVGSSKSTIVRRLKKGLEHYSRTDDGALYTFGWFFGDATELQGNPHDIPWEWCPMHEDPLHLVPDELRPKFLEQISASLENGSRIQIEGDLCPSCRYHYRELMERYDGDWSKTIQHVRVRRLVFSEKDRIGIGTFQPKDEKNQDSTELTGDINYRKIAQYGSDSDPRAFNFDGEFNIANRGLVEFVEVLKLETAFLYDLLGASQEHKVKSKKFAQMDIDEVIIGHSVAGATPIPYRQHGLIGWTTLEDLYTTFGNDTTGLEVLAYDLGVRRARWTPVNAVIRHPFTGNMLTTSQKWGVVETTPNHSIYGRDGKTFYPEECHEVLAVRHLDATFEPDAEFDVIDVVAGIDGFVRDTAKQVSDGGKMTRPCEAGWARLDLPRHATAIRATYHPIHDAEALKDLITVLVWYATEGHVNGQNGGIVISQANRDELERVRGAYARVTTGQGSIDAGAKTDSAWRLYLGSEAIARLAQHHCGQHAAKKRLPDWLFQLPSALLQHAFDELMRTDGSRQVHEYLERTASQDYLESFFEYKTTSPILAAQVGTLASLLNLDYSVYCQERIEREPVYRVRFVSGNGKRGGRHIQCETRLLARPVEEEWVYDIECAGIHNFVCGIGNIVCHNTNEPEYRKLQNNEFMEALKDRTVRIDIPYITKLKDEIKIYEKSFNDRKVRGKHIAPHTIEMAAMWAVLTRLEEPKKANLTLLQKLKLYNGKSLPGFTEDNIKELRKEAQREGMNGISPRYIQDKISNALVNDGNEGCVNPFMVLNELEGGLKNHSLISNEEDRKLYRDLLGVVKDEYAEIVKNEVQRAISADEDAISRLCGNYIDNIKAYTQRERVRNRYTGQYEEPDERLMRSIEEKIDIAEGRKDDFRREIMNYIGALAIEGKKFDYKTNERLHRALELKLFEDQKDSIKLTSLVSQVIDRDTQEKIDVVQARLIRDYGYCDKCAVDVLTYVASIFARGDVRNRN